MESNCRCNQGEMVIEECPVLMNCCKKSSIKTLNCCNENKPQPCHYYNTNFKKYSISFQISHANDVETVTVTTTKEEPKVKDLLQEIEKTFNIPCEYQRLVCRGIVLHQFPEKKLDALGIFPMSVIRLSGVRNNYNSSIF